VETLTIAIIDDDYIDRLISKKLIARISPGIKTIEFESASNALQYLSENADKETELPDVVLLDIRMPRMSGWDYLELYHKIEEYLIKQPKHYIYTSSIDPDDLNPHRDDIHGVYTKPFEDSSLLKIIESGMRD
jgi:CheY-like chemotaxis protein